MADEIENYATINSCRGPGRDRKALLGTLDRKSDRSGRVWNGCYLAEELGVTHDDR